MTASASSSPRGEFKRPWPSARVAPVRGTAVAGGDHPGVRAGLRRLEPTLRRDRSAVERSAARHGPVISSSAPAAISTVQAPRWAKRRPARRQGDRHHDNPRARPGCDPPRLARGSPGATEIGGRMTRSARHRRAARANHPCAPHGHEHGQICSPHVLPFDTSTVARRRRRMNLSVTFSGRRIRLHCAPEKRDALFSGGGGMSPLWTASESPKRRRVVRPGDFDVA